MKIKLFKDILKVKIDGVMKYSQGRVYLFVFILAYIASLAYYMFSPPAVSMQTIIDSLQWAITVFAVYVFGDKGVKIAKDAFTPKNGTPDVSTTDTQTPVVSQNTTTTQNTKTIPAPNPNDMAPPELNLPGN